MSCLVCLFDQKGLQPAEGVFSHGFPDELFVGVLLHGSESVVVDLIEMRLGGV